jgi:YD repeat-containing protein
VTASDDTGVSRVDFMVDGVLVGSDTTGPSYSLAWNTTAPLTQAFDGSHQLTVRATDASGQTTTSPAVAVTVDNNNGGPYKASYTLNGYGSSTETFELPPMIDTDSTQDTTVGGTGDVGGGTGTGGKGALSDAPSCDVLCGGATVASADDSTAVLGETTPSSPNAFQLDVDVRNDSSVGWKNSTTGTGLQLWYRWYTDDGVVLFEGPGSDYFPATLNPGAKKTIPMTIEPPPGVNASQRTRLRLRFDVYDSTTGKWFAQGGSKPVDNPVIVNKDLSKQLGFERFWHYEDLHLGAGASAAANVANGNLLWQWMPWATPGRGIASIVNLSYNSLEEHSDSPAGNNVSLNISGLVRFGSRLDIHPNKADQLNGKARRYVRFVDGDGTLHEFTGTVNTDGTVTWAEPAGVNLYLRSTGSTDARKYWALTRPDRLTYYFDVDGYPRLVEDTNGNLLEFELADTPSGDDPGGPKKRVVKIWDAARRAYSVDYWDKGEAKPGRVRGKVQFLTDHSGSVLAFDYYNDGNLRRITQQGGVSPEGVAVADRSFTFTYTDSNGDQPAIPVGADRVNPDPATNNQSVKVYSVRDPNGRETLFTYWGASPDPKNRWKIKTWTDRAGKTTNFAYDWQFRVTTVDEPASRDTDYSYDTAGRVVTIVDPAERTTALEWSADNKVTKVAHPSGRSETFTYDPNGYLTSDTNEAGETSRLTYEYRQLDTRDALGHWGVLKTRELPEGVATPTAGDHTWTFRADADGNVIGVKNPDGFETTYDYNLRGTPDAGTVKAQIRPRGGRTSYEYHASGLPAKITDPVGNITTYAYDSDSRVIAVQDGEHQTPPAGTAPRANSQTFDFDEFGRLARLSEPKSTSGETNRLIWTTTQYDANDNTTATSVPAYAGIEGPPDAAQTTVTYDEMDRPLLTTGPDTSADPAGERTQTTYDDAGRPITQVAPKGVMSSTVAGDYQTVTTYDVLDRVTRVAAYGVSSTDVRYTHQCYNSADDVVSITAPRANLATIDCAATGLANTTRYTYDNAHRITAVTDPGGHQQRATYDKNGRVTSAEQDIDASATPKRVQHTDITYNGRGLPLENIERFSGTTTLTSRYEYDDDGNTTAIMSPRAIGEAGAGAVTKYVTRHEYDLAGRRTRTTLPFERRVAARVLRLRQERPPDLILAAHHGRNRRRGDGVGEDPADLLRPGLGQDARQDRQPHTVLRLQRPRPANRPHTSQSVGQRRAGSGATDPVGLLRRRPAEVDDRPRRKHRHLDLRRPQPGQDRLRPHRRPRRRRQGGGDRGRQVQRLRRGREGPLPQGRRLDLDLLRVHLQPARAARHPARERRREHRRHANQSTEDRPAHLRRLRLADQTGRRRHRPERLPRRQQDRNHLLGQRLGKDPRPVARRRRLHAHRYQLAQTPNHELDPLRQRQAGHDDDQEWVGDQHRDPRYRVLRGHPVRGRAPGHRHLRAEARQHRDQLHTDVAMCRRLRLRRPRQGRQAPKATRQGRHVQARRIAPADRRPVDPRRQCHDRGQRSGHHDAQIRGQPTARVHRYRVGTAEDLVRRARQHRLRHHSRR